jgi:hypothetical protein
MQRALRSDPHRPVILAAWAAAVVVLVSASFPGAQASKAERSSAWRDRPIAIDGSDEDWEGLTLPARNAHVALGFVNDGDFLYLCLLAKHQQTRAQIATTGLIVWLDAEAGRKNTFGVRFPSERSMTVRGQEQADDRTAWPDEIDVLGPGKNKAKPVPLDLAGGIEASAGMHEDVFVVELRVPLEGGAGHPYAIGLSPGQVVRATIRTPDYRGPYPRSPYIPAGSIGLVIASGGTAVGGGVVGGIPVGTFPVVLPPLSVQTTVLLAAK